jgi:lantibiotic biosynthesis dehydratase-like protein
MTDNPDGLVPLGDTGWHVWQSAILRGTGFPADGLDRLATPECATAADAHLAGELDRETFAATFETATAELTARLCDIAADPLFREAVTWQNIDVVDQLDRFTQAGQVRSRNKQQRRLEIVITRYWQRYCGKNDTIGFFGPVCWVRFDPTGPAVRAKPGPGLVRHRVVDLERRVLASLADTIAADPRYRPVLPVCRQPHLAMDGDQLLRVGVRPERLPAGDAALLAASDGTRTAAQVAALALADSKTGLRKEADAFLALDRLAEQGLLRWRFDPPVDHTAEHRLRESLAGIDDPELRGEALGMLHRLETPRAELAGAAGDPDTLNPAMRRLEDSYVELTGGPTKHQPGATYAGRGVAYEDTARDLDLTIGAEILTALGPALAPLLLAGRWLTAATAEACDAMLRDLYKEAVAETGTDNVPLGELWVLARSLMFGAGPAAEVGAEFTRRWSELLGLNELSPGVRRITLDAAELSRAVAEAFPADAPGWLAGRLHSPDLQLCADSVEALARGEFTAVLGELHIASFSCGTGNFTRFHPEPETLRAALHRDLGDRVVLLEPPEEPGVTARLADLLIGPGDVLLAYTPAPAPTLAGILPLAGLTASIVDGQLAGRAPDGRTWPVLELLGAIMSGSAVDAFKLAGAGPHTPRVTVDRLVIHRETWRTTVGACGLVAPSSEADRYLAVRRWRASLGLPERVFIRVGTEVKPCYVDLTSPASVAAFTAMVRAAHRTGGDQVSLTVSEALPVPEQAWVPDAAGRRYFSELRMTVRDPIPAANRRRKS